MSTRDAHLEKLICQERARMERMVREGDHEGLRAYLQEYVDGLDNYSPREDTAHHEAGHAVAAVTLGIPVVEARIDSGGAGEWGELEDLAASFGVAGGHVLPTDWDWRAHLPERDDGLYTAVERVLAHAPLDEVYLAGEIAALLHWQPDIAAEELQGLLSTTNTDALMVDHWLRWVYDDVAADVADARTWLIEETYRLVKDWWPAIERVAEALMERKVLSGEEVAGLAEQHSPGKSGRETPIRPEAPGTS
jgi:hypothetical protein